MNAKRIIANSLIAVGLAVLTYVASWVVGLVQAAKAAADAGQRATAGPLLVWVFAMIPAAMVLIVIGIVMRSKNRSA
ncbi:MAG: hypothetical protein NTV52_12350 [Acidobacteria bacterium]|jgi:uncharacterized membrane protein|nr:hypothetical protein [Acidobacteriota bacterium]